MLKILFISSDINLIGGIEKYNRDFIDALKKAGSHVTLVKRYKGGLWAKISFILRVIIAIPKVRPNFICCAHLNFATLCLIIKKLFKILNSQFDLMAKKTGVESVDDDDKNEKSSR